MRRAGTRDAFVTNFPAAEFRASCTLKREQKECVRSCPTVPRAHSIPIPLAVPHPPAFFSFKIERLEPFACRGPLPFGRGRGPPSLKRWQDTAYGASRSMNQVKSHPPVDMTRTNRHLFVFPDIKWRIQSREDIGCGQRREIIKTHDDTEFVVATKARTRGDDGRNTCAASEQTPAKLSRRKSLRYLVKQVVNMFRYKSGSEMYHSGILIKAVDTFIINIARRGGWMTANEYIEVHDKKKICKYSKSMQEVKGVSNATRAARRGLAPLARRRCYLRRSVANAAKKVQPVGKGKRLGRSAVTGCAGALDTTMYD
ncbi:hypothetical protein EVAR_4482_1 [Eumeta japonica]|uniref:Uncharacterized protein n=1 Tax=Eumeta variegata TaxID=151549 RepID=A0A4C1T1C9_EUMVA|nr:hypothetical protein EVAR_4482_1 [Eumeta japonica]